MQTGQEAIAQRGQARRFGWHCSRAKPASGAEADDVRHGQGAAAHAALVAAAIEERFEADMRVPAAHIQGADALRPIHLVGGQAEQIDLQGLHIERNLACRLRRVGVEQHAALLQTPPMAAIGCSVPISLLAAMMETRIVLSVIASATCWAVTRPKRSTGKYVT